MASTTYLNLVNSLLRRLNEVEIAQSDFTSVRGVQAMAKDAITASIQMINQFEYTWPFNASTGTQILTAGTEQYSWPSNVTLPNWQSFHINRDDLLSQNGKDLEYIPREMWLKKRRVEDEYAGATGLSVPDWVFEAHGYGFAVSPSPDKAYTVSFEYWTLPTDMSAYDDTPLIPTQFDETILQGGLYHMYMWRDNSEETAFSEKKFKDHLQHMRTLLINKEDRVYGSFLKKRNGTGMYAIPVAGWYM